MTAAAEAPLSDMNTTPLIDVLLVLLIMFIITIPLQTHSVKLDLPSGRPPVSVIVNPAKNKITVDPSGTVRWNGKPTGLAELRQALELTKSLDPVPELHLQPHPEARYAVVNEVLAITKRANVEAMGFVGNEAYRDF